MKHKIFILSLVLLFSINLFSRQTQILKQVAGTNPVEVYSPVQFDTLNIKGKKFEKKNLLETSVTIPDQSLFTNIYDAGEDGFITLQKPVDDGKTSLQLFSFYISSDRYAEGTLKITSPGMLEVYLDGKLKKTKSSEEKDSENAKDVTVEVSPYPRTNHVVIKLMATGDTIPAVSTLKVEIENEKNDSVTNFSMRNTDKRLINMSDMVVGNRVTNIKMSPNGRYVLVFYRTNHGEKSNSYTELYNIKTNQHILIDTDGRKRQLGWMPKSDNLFYLSRINDEVNLIQVNPATFEETVIAKNIPDVSVTISPDEKTLFYSKQDKGAEVSGDLILLKSVEDRQPGYSNRTFIYKYDLATGVSQQLTFGTRSTYLNDISFDSKQLLISYTEETITERPFKKYTMVRLDIPTMKVDTLWKDDGFATSAVFSPDAKKILISGSAEAFGNIGSSLAQGEIDNSYNKLAFIMDLATKKIDPITKDFDPSISRSIWNKQDGQIYFLTTNKDSVTVFGYNTANRKFNKLPLKEEVIRAFDIASNTSVAAYMGLGQSNSTKAYTYNLKNQKSDLIADPFDEQLSKLELGKIEDCNFINSDGTEIQAKYFLPPGFDPSKKYPMIVYYYGGTTPSARTFEASYPGHVFAAQGYVVFMIQPSGAIGYGQKFAAMHVNAWGKRTAEDIIEGTTRFLEEHTYVDAGKIGCIGASYGGFMTMYLQTQTDMFSAAVSHAGISSIASYWGEGYWGYAYSSGASAHSYPWNNPELYVGQSPLFHADKIKTPILLTHGMVDTNVPIGESIQMYTALQILGVPVELLQVKNENHGISNYKRRLEWNNSIMAWFDKWLKDDARWWDSMYKTPNP